MAKHSGWRELQGALIDRFHGNQWVFRGQGSSSWQLETKLERVCRSFEGSKYREAEFHLLHQFQRRLHHYLADVPEKDDILEWFALMQHHGAPTRLLDWTRSPFVAAFFAVEQCSERSPCAVWVVTLQALHNDVLKKNEGYVGRNSQCPHLRRRKQG